MTRLLEEAIRAVRALPEAEQDAIAAAILADIADEQRWSDAFARSHDVLSELADEALADDRERRDLEAAYAAKAADEAREAEVEKVAANAANSAPLDHPGCRSREFGSARGSIHLAEDFDAPLEEFRDYM